MSKCIHSLTASRGIAPASANTAFRSDSGPTRRVVASRIENILSRFLLCLSYLCAAVLILSGFAPASAQTLGPPTNSATANVGTVGVISGGADGTYIRIAADLSNVLDTENIRILP